MNRYEHEILIAQLEGDITTYTSKSIDKNIIHITNYKYPYKLWVLFAYLDLLVNHNVENDEYNILTNDEANNVLEHLLYILNITYSYRF